MRKLREQIETLLAQITVLRRRLIVKKAKDFLGIDFTDDRIAPDPVACVQAVTTLLSGLGLLPRVEIGTYTFGHKLMGREYKNWLPTDKPESGCIAIAMTGTGNGTKRGHCWIVGDNGIWYSNDSYTGKWQANYTLATAYQSYTKEGGMKIYYFKYVTAL